MIELAILILLFILLYVMLPNRIAFTTRGIATIIEEDDEEAEGS